MKKVDVLQVFISSSAIVGIGIIWINFNVKVFQTVWDLMKAPFTEVQATPTPNAKGGATVTD